MFNADEGAIAPPMHSYICTSVYSLSKWVIVTRTDYPEGHNILI